jgi:hypothetical protein
MCNALAGIGFANAEATIFSQTWRLKSAQQMLDAIYEGTVRTRAVLAAQTPNVIAKITAYIEAGIAGTRTADGTLNVPMPAIIGSGNKR